MVVDAVELIRPKPKKLTKQKTACNLMTDKQSCKSFSLDFTHCCTLNDDEVVELRNMNLLGLSCF